MISPSPLDTILWFANIEEEIDPIDNVEALFERHKTGPEWDRLNPKDLAGYHAYMVLRDKVREWLDILIKGSTAKKKKVARAPYLSKPCTRGNRPGLWGSTDPILGQFCVFQTKPQRCR